MRRRINLYLRLLLSFVVISPCCIQAEEPVSSSCGVENCHGLTVKCGPHPVEACSMMYELGDKCRQHVRCETVEGKCVALESEEFHKCRTCVEQCRKKESPDDPAKVFSCEAECK